MPKYNTFTELDYKILESLISFIRENIDDPRVITYKQLVKRVNDPSVIPVNMGSHLGRIGEAINSTLTHAPIPNGIVVNQDTGKAGEGYGEIMNSMGRVEPSVQDIYSYDKWDLVLDIVRSGVGKIIY